MKADEFMKQLENDQNYHVNRAKAESTRKEFLVKIELEQAPIVNSLKKLGIEIDLLDELFRKNFASFSTEVGETILASLSAENTTQRTVSDCGRLLERLPLDSQAVTKLIEFTAELHEKRPADDIALSALVQAIAAHRGSAGEEMIASLAKKLGAGPLKKLLLERRKEKFSSAKVQGANGKTENALEKIRRWFGLG
jgi:type I site-specific restriction endonuclease